MTTYTNLTGRGAIAAAAVLSAGALSAAEANLEPFLAGVQSGDPDIQLAAWKEADKQGAAAIAPLSKLLTSDNMSIAKTASQSIMKIVHSVGQTKDNPARKEVIRSLIELLKLESKVAQTLAFRALSLLADSDSVAVIAPFLGDADLREEAVFCLERIPGEAAIDALIDGAGKVPDEFKPRVFAALGHRKAEKAVPAIENYMQSANSDLAITAADAISRIGVTPQADPPAEEKLSPRQKSKLLDCYLRFCDARIAKGDFDFAQGYLLQFLSRQDEGVEEHALCAAIISVAKIDKPEITAAIVRQLERPLYIVRDTAVKTLIAMKGSNVDAILNEAAGKTQGDVQSTIKKILEKRKG